MPASLIYATAKADDSMKEQHNGQRRPYERDI